MMDKPHGGFVGIHEVDARHRQFSRRAVATAVLIAVLTSVATTVGGSTPVEAQISEITARIVARKLTDGRIEFGMQRRNANGSWRARQLPSKRYFPRDAAEGRWLSSSSLGSGSDAVRIVARKIADGRVEFGLQQRRGPDSWGQRILPSTRFFPTGASVGRWLVSSPVGLRVAGANRGRADYGVWHYWEWESDGVPALGVESRDYDYENARGDEDPPFLVVTCDEGELSVYVNWHRFITADPETDEISVVVWFHGGDPVTEGWWESTTFDATHAPRPREFVRSAQDSRMVTISVREATGTPFGFAYFELRGLAAGLSRVPCYSGTVS